MDRSNSNGADGQQQSGADLAHLNRICTDAASVSQALSDMGSGVNLVSPATICPILQPGCGVAFSAIQFDPNPEQEDVYPVGGVLGLRKASLDRIGVALGVNWDFDHSRRLDDRSHRWYFEYQAVGAYRRFDGLWAQIMDHKTMDLREGSAQVAQVYRDAKEGTDPEATVEVMRSRIGEQAVTRARLRALRTVGLKTSYTPEEISRPFVVANLIFHGMTDDPDMKPVFAVGIMMNMLAGGRPVFDQGAAEALMGATRRETPLSPPLTTSPATLPTGQGSGATAPPASPTQDNRPSNPTPSGTNQRPRRLALPSPGTGSEPTVGFGRNKGVAVSVLSRDELGWYRGKVQQSIDDPEQAEHRDRNLRHMEEIRSEVRRRQEVAKATTQDPPPDQSKG